MFIYVLKVFWNKCLCTLCNEHRTNS